MHHQPILGSDRIVPLTYSMLSMTTVHISFVQECEAETCPVCIILISPIPITARLYSHTRPVIAPVRLVVRPTQAVGTPSFTIVAARELIRKTSRLRA